MAQIKLLPPAAYLHACFIYKPETGDLIWRKRPLDHFADARNWARCNTMLAGKRAGSFTISSHRVVLLNQTPYLVHRIAWKMMINEEPPDIIDHVNGVPFDNRWANLRAATTTQHIGNQRIHSTNTSGHRGVYLHRQQKKWVAQLGRRYLGIFNSLESAVATYDAAAHKHFGEFYSKR